MENTTDLHTSNKYFYGELKSAVIDDKYHTWWFKGVFWVASNSNLPNYSYYLDIRSEIGEFNNVPLHWAKTIQTKHKSDGTIAYTIDEYQFNFSFNFAQSSQFSEYLKYREFQFNLTPMFNQNIINDFSISVTTKEIQELIKEMNFNKNNKIFDYANNIDIVTGDNFLLLNPMNQDQQLQLQAFVKPPHNSRPYVDLIEFKNLTSKFNLLKAEFKIISLNNSLEFSLLPTLYHDSQVMFQIPYCIYLNEKNEFIIDKSNHIFGLFSMNDIRIDISGSIKFEYQKMIRIVNFTQTILFDKSSTNNTLSKINLENNCVLNVNYLELENEKVF